jgi:flagellar protein FlaG
MSIPVGPVADSAWAAQLLANRGGEADALSASRKAPDSSGVDAPVSPGSIESAVQEINESMKGQSVGVQFEVDKDTDKLVVKVVDRVSGELIRQIPSEEVLRIAKLLGKVPGALMDQSA